MIVKTKLTGSDFTKASGVILSKIRPLRFAFWIFAAVAVFVTIVNIISKPNITELITSLLPFAIIGSIWIALWSLFSKRGYKTNKKLGEDTEYEFSGDELLVRGETYSGTVKISSLWKVEKTKDWLLIWQVRGGGANPIPLRDVSGSQLLELKGILANAGVSNNL